MAHTPCPHALAPCMAASHLRSMATRVGHLPSLSGPAVHPAGAAPPTSRLFSLGWRRAKATYPVRWSKRQAGRWAGSCHRFTSLCSTPSGHLAAKLPGVVAGEGAAPPSASNRWVLSSLRREEHGWVCSDTPLHPVLSCSRQGALQRVAAMLKPVLSTATM